MSGPDDTIQLKEITTCGRITSSGGGGEGGGNLELFVVRGRAIF